MAQAAFVELAAGFDLLVLLLLVLALVLDGFVVGLSWLLIVVCLEELVAGVVGLLEADMALFDNDAVLPVMISPAVTVLWAVIDGVVDWGMNLF